MYLPDSGTGQNPTRTLDLLESASHSPTQIYEDNPEVKDAFDQSLRDLAEDIITHHPDLAHILIGMSDTPSFVHGQN